MMEYGCIGEKLTHSFSREIHRALAPYTYELMELKREEVGAFLLQKEFHGINVTIPYKETVLPYLDEVEESAREIGAVNTIVHRDGHLYGYNTDVYGMRALFSLAGIHPEGKKVAILGTGGTSKTARAVARTLGAREILIVSRTPSDSAIGYADLREEHSDIDILINTTPVGMYPETENCPLTLDAFPSLVGVIDAIYNPLSTDLILQARARGICAVGGLYMLVAQAVRASELFLGTSYPEGTLECIYQRVLKEKQNIVLIGMPTSGKSTVGRMLSQVLARPFFDTDTVYREMFGFSAEETILKEGEAIFRERESEVCLCLRKETGAVIATGGGVILREENIRTLSHNGIFVFLDRPLEELTASDTHPLSSTRETLQRLYEERIDKYLACADLTISGALSVEDTVEHICQCLGLEFAK